MEAVFTNPADYSRLLPGYSADLEIILDTRDNILRIPTEALLVTELADAEKQSRVLVLPADDNTLRERDVDTGLSNWKLTEITKGLNEGDKVVITLDRKGVEAGALVTSE